MTKTQLAKAISIAAAGLALSAVASTASAHVMYNTFTTTATSQTDGWTRTFDGSDADSIATGPESKGNSGTLVPWVGTSGGALPYGYTGSSHLNWAATIHGAGDSLEVSAADALADYSVNVEIDTGGGAWRDTSASPTGWKHQTDIGLIKSLVTQKVILNLSTISNTFSRFGVTVFSGMDTNTANYSHHGSWNNASKPYTLNNPFGTTGLTNIKYSDNVTATNGIEFTAYAGQVYSIYLGGVDFSHWASGVDGYKLNITTAPVPVPGAIWLFGSAIAGLVGFGRRKTA